MTAESPLHVLRILLSYVYPIAYSSCTLSVSVAAGRYGTYKMVQAAKGGSHHVGFTRILHRTQVDPLMAEVISRSSCPAIHLIIQSDTDAACTVLHPVVLTSEVHLSLHGYRLDKTYAR